MPLHTLSTYCRPSRLGSPKHMRTREVSELSQVGLNSDLRQDFFLKVAVVIVDCIFNGRQSIEIQIIIVSHV